MRAACGGPYKKTPTPTPTKASAAFLRNRWMNQFPAGVVAHEHAHENAHEHASSSWNRGASGLDRGRRDALAAMLVVAASALLQGCGGAQSVPNPAPAPKPRPLFLNPPQSLVAAGGLEWIVVARLRELAASPAVGPGLTRLFPDARLAAFEHATAIDLKQVQTAAVASYPNSTLYIVNGVAKPMEAELRFRSKLMGDEVRTAMRADVALVHGRTGSSSLRAMAAMLPDTVAIESGGTSRAKAAAMYALGKLQRSPRALQIPDLEALAQRLGPAPVLAFAPGPFEGDYKRALRGLLGAASAVGAAIRITPIGTLQGSFAVAGPWGERAEAASARLAMGWQDVAESAFGRLTGLNEPLRAPLSTHAVDAVSLTVEVAPDRFLDGLRAAVSAQVSEIMR
jgi:hypothetical protein